MAHTHADESHEHHTIDATRPDALYEDKFYDGRQTVILFGTMGLSFLILLVILFVIAG